MKLKTLLGGNTQTALLTGVAVAVIGAWVTHFLGPRTEPPVPLSLGGADPVSLEKLLAESRISFADWQALVKEQLDREQRKKIFERYRGERVTWRGYFAQVNRIKPEYGASTSAQFLLDMYENKETLNARSLGRAPALCVFPVEAEEKLSALQHGQRIVVQGTFAAPSLHGELLGTKLYNCQLLGL